MEFHWPTAGITTAVMVVLLCVVYFIAVYLRGGQAYFPILTEAIVCVGLLCGAYNTGGMTEEQAKKEKQEFVEYNRIYSQAAGMTGEPRRAFLTQQFNEHLPDIRPSEIEDDDWEYENNGILE